MGGGVCAIGFGEGMGENKVGEAVGKALDTQLLDIGDTEKAEGALIHIEGGDDMTLEDVNRAGEIVVNRIAPNARVSWGARVNSALQGSLRATVVLAGVDSPFMVEELKPFGVIRKMTAETREAEVTEKTEKRPTRKGLFGKILG